MIIHCNTPTHPLIHDGTQQRERLLQALVPDNLKLDNQSIEELVAFAGKFAKQIRFWDENNEPNGDWTNFWESDTTALLAIMVSTDLEAIRTTYRTKELEYLALKDREDKGLSLQEGQSSKAALEALVIDEEFGIYGLTKRILELCKKAPADHRLKQTIVRIIRTNLQLPLQQLIQFHKAIDPKSYEKYQAFIGTDACTAPWGLPTSEDFKCLDYILPYDYQEALWKLFLKFYQSLKLIVDQAGRAFSAALRTRSDHQPHITLFLTFLHLFRYLQSDLNALTDKHLSYYYKDILRLETRRLIPDRVHVVFQIAENLERYRIKEGTLLIGGADLTGVPRLYSLTEELVASRAALVEKRNFYFNKKANLAIVLPAADKRDGVEEDYTKGTKAWHPLSGRPVYERYIYRYKHFEKLQKAINDSNSYFVQISEEIKEVSNKLAAIDYREGFEIHSPEFVMFNNDKRYILIRFNGISKNNFEEIVANYSVNISIEKGIKELKVNKDIVTENLLFEGQEQQIRKLTEKLKEGNFVIYACQAIEPIVTDVYNSSIITSSNNSSEEYPSAIYFAFISLPEEIKLAGLSPVTPPFIRFLRTPDFDKQNRISYKEPISFISVDVLTVSISSKISAGLPPFSGSVSGKVVDSKGEPLIGASVILLGTTTGTVTDIDGKYSLDISTASSNELAFSYTGYENKRIFVTSSIINVILNNANEHSIPEELNTIFPNYYDNPILYRFTSNLKQIGEEVIFFNEDDNKAAYIVIPEFYIKKFNTVDSYYNANLTIIISNPDIILIPISERIIKLIAIIRAPNQPVTLKISEIGFSYYSNPKTIELDASKPNRIEYINQLGHWGIKQNSKPNINIERFISKPLLRQPLTLTNIKTPIEQTLIPDGNGNLFLGFERLQPNQTLSLLFKMAEGTGNPNYFAPKVRWAYLKDEVWVQFPPQFILKDETLGLKQTGIIRFQIPSDINSGNKRLLGADERTDLFWLSVSAEESEAKNEYVDALPMLEDIHVHAATAVFEDDDNDLKHIEPGLAPMTISDLRFRDVNVDTVTQPYRSFEGRLPEGNDRLAYYGRINERLRHGHRAVSIWDYERLVLEAFPKVAIVKGLSHSKRFAMAMPGHVTLVAMPYPSRMIGSRIFYPNLDAGDLKQIQQFLHSKANYFVTGYADPVFCCGEKNCGCSPSDGLSVINPRYEPVRLKVCVRFKEGLDIPFYTKELNEALKSFLAPWATDEQKPILFGNAIHTTELLQFLENLDYMDVIIGLAVKHFATREDADKHELHVEWSKPDRITPYTSASLLTSYLDRLNEDNPNVIDHEINVIDAHSRCTCINCQGEIDDSENSGTSDIPDEFAKSSFSTAPPKSKPKPSPVGNIAVLIDEITKKAEAVWAETGTTNDVAKVLKKELKELVLSGQFKGKVPADIFKAKLKTNAFSVGKGKKVGKKISSLEVKMKLDDTNKLSIFKINNPKLKS